MSKRHKAFESKSFGKSPANSLTVKAIWVAIAGSLVICNISFAFTFIQEHVIAQGEVLEISNPDVSIACIAFLGISLWLPLFGISCLGVCFLVILLLGNWPHAGSRNFWFVSVVIVSVVSFFSFFLASPMNKETIVSYSTDLVSYLVSIGLGLGIIRLILHFGRKWASRK